MSTDFSLNSGMARDKLYGLSKLKQQNQQQVQEQQQQNQVMQQPATSTIQWTQAAQAVEQVGNQNVQNQARGLEIQAPNLEDVAMLTSTVSTKEESIAHMVGQKIISHLGINVGALKEKFKEYYRQSKSHNLLLERFMANVKMSGLNAMLTLAGLSADEIEHTKAEVREEALKEIDSKLQQDWAYAKAMIEIVG
ncbi:MAG: hypothetical protein ABIA63_09170 [bacterium]